MAGDVNLVCCVKAIRAKAESLLRVLEQVDAVPSNSSPDAQRHDLPASHRFVSDVSTPSLALATSRPCYTCIGTQRRTLRLLEICMSKGFLLNMLYVNHQLQECLCWPVCAGQPNAMCSMHCTSDGTHAH